VPRRPRRPDYAEGNQRPLFMPDSDWKVQPLPDLRNLKEIGLDTETKDEGLKAGRGPGWVYKAGYVSGFSVAWGGMGHEQAAYFPLRHPESENIDLDAANRWLHDHRHLRWVMQNAPYDLGWLRADFDIMPPVSVDDTTAMSVMLDTNHTSYNLDAIAKRCGVPGKDETLLREYASVTGLNPKSDIWRMPAKYVGPYGGDDALAALRCGRVMRPLINDEGSHDAYQVEMDLIPLIQEMRWRGIRIDMDYAERSLKELYRLRDEAFTELNAKLGERVGIEEIGKNTWLTKVFDAHGISYPRTAATSRFPNGQPSFSAGIIGWMHKHEHWLPTLIVKADKYHNAASKFLQGYIIDYCHKGRLHATINQFMNEDDEGARRGTRSHRFSFSDPPLQQMPSRDEEFKQLIRGCFLPEIGEKWGRIDYSQQEYVLMVHFAYRLKLTKAAEFAQRYRDNPKTDFHKLVQEWTGLDRIPAKQASFAKAYGAAIKKFALLLGQSEQEAEKVMTKYDAEVPFVGELAEECKRFAGRRGWIKLIDGARLHYTLWEGPWLGWEEKKAALAVGHNLAPCSLEEAQARASNEMHPWYQGKLRRADTRKALNGLIQGSAARQTKRAMRDCWRAGIVPLIQIHDELGISAPNEAYGSRVAELMRETIKLEIPVSADCDYGSNWANAKYNWEEAK
jgi:DNA polymerase I